MFILVKRNCLSAHGKIFRRGEVVELDDETGKALLASEDYTEVVLQESAADKKAESEDALPVPDVEGTVEG